MPVLYELDKKKEWKDSEAWQKANQALGSIKNEGDIRQKVKRAKNSPNELTGLLTKDFNIRDSVHIMIHIVLGIGLKKWNNMALKWKDVSMGLELFHCLCSRWGRWGRI